ncbi:MAG: ABC transporter ATP-binding protein [Anaerolineaceae bacterium]|nr:ABC transporter ATP-binding protein [Anaerolineaceae bacterium]
MMQPHGSGWGSRLRQSTDEKPKVTWALMRRVLAYSQPYRWQIIWMLVLILITSGLSLITPLILRDLIDRTIPNGDINRLIWLAVLLLILPAFVGVFNVWQRRLNSKVGEGVIYDLRVALYARLQRMSLRFFTHTRVGELMSRLNNDVVGAQNAISNTIVNMITNIFQAAGILIVMLSLNWQLTLVSIIILPLFILVADRMSGRLREIARSQMDVNAQMNATVNETLNIGGALLIKLFGRMQTEISRFQERAGKVRDLGIQRAVIGRTFFIIISLLSAIGTALVYGVGGYLVIKGAFTIGTIVAFGAYLTSLYASLQGLANAPVEFSTSIVSFERVFEVIDLPVDIEEQENAKVLKDVAGELIFDNVCFRYEVDQKNLLRDVHRHGQMDTVSAVLSGQEVSSDDSTPSQARDDALEDISFQVKPGQLVALVGPSGAGKTTMTYLIPRLYDPTTGAIRIDGHDLRSITLDSLSAQIGMVTQETYLFHDSIKTNLLYARPDATQEELEAAARTANIHNFIADLPEGYNTIVGERGYRLSGGEKQRLALARVILKDPNILVLDEATSHLDSESEALIQEALKEVMADRTSIVIAHRLSTILAADLILVLDRGRIVEQGSHQELQQRDGLYAHLYQTQFSQSA